MLQEVPAEVKRPESKQGEIRKSLPAFFVFTLDSVLDIPQVLKHAALQIPCQKICYCPKFCEKFIFYPYSDMFFSIKIYHTACFFKLKKRFCLRSVDAAWSNVFFLRRVRCGIRLRPAGLRRDKVYRQITCMRHRSLNNFHKKWDNNNVLQRFDIG